MENLGIMERIEGKLDVVIDLLKAKGATVDAVAETLGTLDPEPKADKKPKGGANSAKPAPKGTAVDNGDPEIATRNRWIMLTDGTIGAYIKGDQLPPVADRVKNVTKGEYQKWFDSQLADQETEDVGALDDGTFGGTEFDDEFANEAPVNENPELLPFDIFKTVVKLYGSGKNAAKGRALMVKHSMAQLPNIGQYEEDIEGRNAIIEELQAWPLYQKALDRAKSV